MAKAAIRQARARRRNEDALRSAWHVLEEWVEANRRPIGIITSIAAAAAIVFGLIYYFTEYRHTKALAAFNGAYSKFTATVGTPPATPGLPAANKVSFPDKETKFREAAAAFEAVANDYSSYEDVAHYYAGLSYLEVEPEKGVKLLEDVVSGGDAGVRTQARLALAEHFAGAGELERSEALYQQLVDDPGTIPAGYLKVRLAAVKERLNKNGEAAAIYRQVVDVERDSAAGMEAEKGLQRVDPKQAAALPPKAPPAGPGGITPFSTSTQAPTGGF